MRHDEVDLVFRALEQARRRLGGHQLAIDPGLGNTGAARGLKDLQIRAFATPHRRGIQGVRRIPELLE